MWYDILLDVEPPIRLQNRLEQGDITVSRTGKTQVHLYFLTYKTELPKYAFKRESLSNQLDFDLIFGVLTPLSTIFQLYHGDQF
jgi:hypothetical protein